MILFTNTKGTTCDDVDATNYWVIGITFTYIIILIIDSNVYYGGTSGYVLGFALQGYGTFIFTNNTYI